MVNLTEISIATRKMAVWLAILFVSYLFIRFLIGLGVAYYKATHPIPPPAPNVIFGKLPSPKFSHVVTSTSGLKFTLENVDGKPPETTDAAKVYSMPKKLPNILAPQRAKEFAVKLGFTGEPQIVSSALYHFTDPSNSLRTLDIDVTTMNYKISYDYLSKPEMLANVQFSSTDQIITDVKNLIAFNNIFDSSVANGIITTDLLQYDGRLKKLVPASSLGNAQAVRLNFKRKDLDKYKILPPEFDKSYTYIIYTQGDSLANKILELSYIYWPISTDNFGTYPLRSGAAAWQDLLDGYAFVINMGNNSPDQITIRNIYIAYYDSQEPQPYLQPIYVFEGDNGFVAYVPAVDNQWLE